MGGRRLQDSLRPLQNPPSAAHFCVVRLCPMGTARSLAYLYDMSVPRRFPAFTFAALLRLELHPHLRVLQRYCVHPSKVILRKFYKILFICEI
ncbi:MAG: hypothetical protein Q4A62_06105 [Eikenella sp.]|nr:hypothetical protein [Eikenella sp.]